MEQGDHQQRATATASPSDREGSARILVVDDEAPLLRLLRFLLERQGYTLFTASDGNDVLPLLRQHRPHLVLLDIMLPNLDGLSLLEAIRADSQLAETPVIVLSAKAQDVDVARGLYAGADLYITKPFRPEELLETVARFLSTAPSAQASA